MSSASFSSSYLGHRSPHYASQNGLRSTDIQTSNSKMEPLISEEVEQVRLHPLIISQDAVVCMPEVNRVLRTVYQVLSQANYYLSKHGISSRRFSGAQLIKIKMLGILNHDAKVCSYILQHEAERIFDSFDLSGSSRKSQKIIWMDPVLLDENGHDKKTGGRHASNAQDKHADISPVDIQTFQLSNDSIVCAPDIQKVIQTHFNQGATTGYYFSKLGIVPFKFIHSAHLDKVKELGIIKKSAVHCTYVSKCDAKRVFEAYGMTKEDMETKINWLTSINLDDLPWRSKWPQHSVKSEMSSPAGNSSTNEANGLHTRNNGSENHETEEPEDQPEIQQKPSIVHIFIVDSNEVVCMPDVHKVVQAAHGSSIQVNYYLNKLNVKKKRFCFAHLKELKTRSILQGNATYCTYIPKIEAEKIFQIYSLMGDQGLSGVEWTGPLRLDKLPGSFMTPHGNNTGNEDIGSALKVATFLVDGEEVLCTPDVHKIVDYLEEQSASLDYHFRKLGIVKRRYTYSQLHQLRRLQIIKRPTVCTYIRKVDVEQLLLMYATDRNKSKMQNIQWLKPISLLSSTHGPQRTTESPNGRASMDDSNNDHISSNNGSPDADLAMSDLYKIYVGEKMGTDNERVPDSPRSPFCQRHKQFAGCSMSSSAELQKANPHIDCPIVIPNADFDPNISSASMNLPSPGHSNVYNNSPESLGNHKDKYPLKRKFCESTAKDVEHGNKAEDDHSIVIERLLKDLRRKETELRCLHDAYQQEITIEKERRMQSEKELDKVKQQLASEQELRGRLENNHQSYEGEQRMNDTVPGHI